MEDYTPSPNYDKEYNDRDCSPTQLYVDKSVKESDKELDNESDTKESDKEMDNESDTDTSKRKSVNRNSCLYKLCDYVLEDLKREVHKLDGTGRNDDEIDLMMVDDILSKLVKNIIYRPPKIH